jgi:serine protease inhibitor
VEPDVLKKIMGALASSKKKTKVILPKFEVAMGESISHGFCAMGLDALFFEEDSSYELEDIVPREPLFVSNITQVVQFKVDVDEIASETQRGGTPVRDYDEQDEVGPLIADPPFVYVLWNKTEQVPLIIGQLYNPRRRQYGSRD